MLSINFNPYPRLSTARLLLREMFPGDVNEVFFLRSDSEVMKYIDKAPAQSLDDAFKWMVLIRELQKKNEGINWAITIHGDKKLLGNICLWNINLQHHRAEVGYVLHPSCWGKGIMQEAMAAVLDYGFKTMKLHSIEANVNPANTASIKLLERNGFVREAYFRENYFYDGKFLDSAIYSLLTPEK